MEQESHCISDHRKAYNEADIQDQEGQNEALLIVGMENHAAEAIDASEVARDILNKYADFDDLDVKIDQLYLKYALPKIEGINQRKQFTFWNRMY